MAVFYIPCFFLHGEAFGCEGRQNKASIHFEPESSAWDPHPPRLVLKVWRPGTLGRFRRSVRKTDYMFGFTCEIVSCQFEGRKAISSGQASPGVCPVESRPVAVRAPPWDGPAFDGKHAIDTNTEHTPTQCRTRVHRTGPMGWQARRFALMRISLAGTQPQIGNSACLLLLVPSNLVWRFC